MIRELIICLPNLHFRKASNFSETCIITGSGNSPGSDFYKNSCCLEIIWTYLQQEIIILFCLQLLACLLACVCPSQVCSSSLRPCAHLSVHPSVFCLPVYLHACLSVCLHVCLSPCLSVCLSPCLSVCLHVFLPVGCLSVVLPVCSLC